MQIDKQRDRQTKYNKQKSKGNMGNQKDSQTKRQTDQLLNESKNETNKERLRNFTQKKEKVNHQFKSNTKNTKREKDSDR